MMQSLNSTYSVCYIIGIRGVVNDKIVHYASAVTKI